MSRANNHGWDFIKVGKVYQYKEDWFIGMVKIIEDKSTDDEYIFTICVVEANCDDMGPEPFTIRHAKNMDGYYSGMLQFYENPEYIPLPLGTPWPVQYPQNK